MAYDDSSNTPSVDPTREAALRSVTAFFDTEEAANHARHDLVQAGVPANDVRVVGGEVASVDARRPHGFWQSLKDLFLPDEDRHLYAEGLRRGGFAVSVAAGREAYDHVIEILDRDGAVDIEERAAGWRDQGWSSFAGTALLGEREMAYASASSGTGGFTASRVDQPLFDGLMDTAAIEPGSVGPVEPPESQGHGRPAHGNGSTDGATAASVISSADTSRPSSTPLATPVRDLSHGRTRVRSYVGDKSAEVLPPD